MKAEKKEQYAVVLDVLLKGRSDDPRPIYKREPLIQGVGIEQFKLLELVPKVQDLKIHELVYIGDEEREKIERVKRRIGYEDLTPTAKLNSPSRWNESLLNTKTVSWISSIRQSPSPRGYICCTSFPVSERS
jgi:predicted nucleic acid-binding OB-fold protein